MSDEFLSNLSSLPLIYLSLNLIIQFEIKLYLPS
jgi:hypothetical protein